MFNPFALLSYASPGLAVLATIFWVWILIDCVTKESSEGNDKVVWTLLILFMPVLGGILYYFVRRPERVKALGQ